MTTLQASLVLAVIAIARCAAQTITPTNWTSGAVVDAGNAIELAVSSGNQMQPLAAVQPLTPQAGNAIPPPGLSGPAVLANTSSQVPLHNNDVALISCDTYPGLIGAKDLLGLAELANATGVVFFSQTADYCNLADNPSIYPWIYSMKSRNDTQKLLQTLGGASAGSNQGHHLYVTIVPFQNIAQVANSTQSNNGSTPNNSSNSGQSQSSSPLGPSPSTAVAMIILYSITGIITALFLIIIVTGAIRAHRHPERYGPRNGLGRPRQSRARGLARAMLDSLPIVKFGERLEPKATDVELADGAAAPPETSSEERGAGAQPELNAANSAPTEDGAGEPQQAPTDGGIAAAAPQERSGPAPIENQGCSICTEDFEIGQDQRVLPCDHRFHPTCIDPWLLNVSGTCPLCRVDLRPQTSPTSDSQELDEDGNPVTLAGSDADGEGGDLPPPLDAAGRQRMSARRSLLVAILGPAAGGNVSRMSREEHVVALRRYRGRQAAARRRRTMEQPVNQNGPVTPTPESTNAEASNSITATDGLGAAADDQVDESRLRTRLRNAFRIRTRRTGAGGQAQDVDGENEADRREADGTPST